MSDDLLRPAWSDKFMPGILGNIEAAGPLGEITRDWAFGDRSGRGVRVAVVDSGIEASHPLLEGSVKCGVAVEYDETLDSKVRLEEDNPPRDLAGHATACAGIIHRLAPGAELVSVRVLGRNMRGKALQFAAGLRWAIQQGITVINLSLSTSKEEYFGLFHSLADEAYFHNLLVISAVNNIPVPSYPSLYASVFSVAAHETQDPEVFYYNPSPPTEFGAPGINVQVAWLEGSTITATGNSFAAPHIAGLVARILSAHPGLTPFEVKTILMACANNRSEA